MEGWHGMVTLVSVILTYSVNTDKPMEEVRERERGGGGEGGEEGMCVGTSSSNQNHYFFHLLISYYYLRGIL